MNESLQAESERLARSWHQHDAAMLRDYLVADVEDPRLNVQSILSRHFVATAALGGRFAGLMDAELRFAAAMNWLLVFSKDVSADPAALLHGLRAGADNAEGCEIPAFLGESFRALPMPAGDSLIPNYLATTLENAAAHGRLVWPPVELETFQRLWAEALAGETPTGIRVIEPACGSANDYRFLAARGLARLVDYTGFDLEPKNVANARELFPEARFAIGNVFEIAAADGAFDLCLVHDLFEHLSPEGIGQAVREICRVTRVAACVHFFNMEERPEHHIEPVDDYHWNRLSMARMREAFAREGFAAQALHVGTFLRARTGCEHTHNPGAYTFVLAASGGDDGAGGLDATQVRG
jgi:SAM-dependent methyltransferase